MNGWEWQAGNTSGLTDSRRRARRHAAAVLREGLAETAVLQEVEIDTGGLSLDGCYRPVTRTRALGRRDGKRIRWRDAAVPQEGQPGNAP